MPSRRRSACAGFQHLVLEVARNVAGFADAAHAEYDPDASRLFVHELACSLVGETMSVTVRPGTLAAGLYPVQTVQERYYCRFGLDPAHVGVLEDAGMVVSGVDQDGEPRIVEIPDRRFCLATLFVPQTSSTPEAPHPIVAGFVAAAHASTLSPRR
jgi:CTP synthase (UTP-ammonia lyase)